MADESSSQDNRATIAQTLAEVRGLRDLTRAEFADLQRQITAVSALPVVVAELKAQNKDQEKRIGALEREDTRGAEWRRTNLPTLLIAALALLASVSLIILQLTAHA